MTPKTKLQGVRSGLRGGIATFGCICQLHGQSSAVEDSRQDILLLKKRWAANHFVANTFGLGAFISCLITAQGVTVPQNSHIVLFDFTTIMEGWFHKWVSSKTHLLTADLANYHKIENVFILSPSVRLYNNCRSYGKIFKGFLITFNTDDFLGLKTDSQTNSTWSKFTAGLPVLFLLLKNL